MACSASRRQRCVPAARAMVSCPGAGPRCQAGWNAEGSAQRGTDGAGRANSTELGCCAERGGGGWRGAHRTGAEPAGPEGQSTGQAAPVANKGSPGPPPGPILARPNNECARRTTWRAGHGHLRPMGAGTVRLCPATGGDLYSPGTAGPLGARRASEPAYLVVPESRANLLEVQFSGAFRPSAYELQLSARSRRLRGAEHLGRERAWLTLGFLSSASQAGKACLHSLRLLQFASRQDRS